MDERGIVFFTSLSQIFNRLSVNEFRCRLVVFRLVNVGVCRTVDNDFDIVIFHKFSHGVEFRDVEFRNISEDVVVGASLRNYTHLVAELTVGACD